MKLCESSSGRVATGTAAVAVGLLSAGCGSRNPNAIQNCERGYNGTPVVAAGVAVRAFSTEAAKVEIQFKNKLASPGQTPALTVAYDEIFNWSDWYGSANTANQADEILCIVHDRSGTQLVLNDHAEAIRGVLKAAGLKFNLSGIIKVENQPRKAD